MGGVLRLVAEVVRSESGIAASVEPVIVAPDSELGRVRGADNLVAVETRWNGVVRLGGPGAGGEATASALLGDLVRGASTLRPTGTVIRGIPESVPHGWLVSIRAGRGADRLLSDIAGRVGATADRAPGPRGVMRAMISALSWHRMELVMRMLLIAGVDPVVSRLEAGSAAAPLSG